ncbi:hypothetical protein Cgig2_028073 [Carnegiea gigantea]|uniref:Uncharacterized protein n=1 Tax=Carnegiea gigantea TaxID=171969 RepID=A0A9Q1GH10_9CARY|nr:hypothetical protein Cgig2_028073 [Carnegiea gigantea]
MRESSYLHPRLLPLNFHSLCPEFKLLVAMQFARTAHIPEMVQAIFYAMVINEVAELGLSSRDAMGHMMLDLRELRWNIVDSWLQDIDERLRDAQVPRLVEMVYNPQPRPEVTSRLRGTPSYLIQALFRCTCIIISSCSSSGDVPEGLFDPQVEGSHPQFPSLLAFISGRVVAGVPPKNQCTTNGQDEVHPRIRSLDELLAEGTQGNPSSAPSSPKPVAEAATTSTSSSLRETSSPSSDGSSRSSSSEGASTSSSSHEGPSTPGRSVLKKRGRSTKGPVPEIVAEEPDFPGAPARSDAQDGQSSHFPNPKVVPMLKRTALKKQYLLPARYTFVIPEVNATVNEPPAKCIAVYRAALKYGLKFPLHSIIEDILIKHELAPAQVVPTSWHNICSFIATCELRGLASTARAFSLVHAVQMTHKETGDLGWYCFNNRPECMTAIEKKSKVIESVKGPEKKKSKSSDRKPLNSRPKLKFFGNDLFLAAAGLLILKNVSKARVKLTVFETGDTTPETVAAEVECCREEERQRLVNQQAKKAPPLVPRGKKPADLVKSWDLAASGTLEPHKVNEEEVTIVEAFARGVKAAAERRMLKELVTRYQRRWEKLKEEKDAREADKKDLQRQLEEVLSKAKAEATAGAERAVKTRAQGYQQGRAAGHIGILTQGLGDVYSRIPGGAYFEAYLDYVDERQQDEVEGRDPEEVEFIPPSGESGGPGDEATNPLDAEVGTPKDEGHEDSRGPDM